MPQSQAEKNATPAKDMLFMVLLKQEIAAWHIPNGKDPGCLLIQGEERLEIGSVDSMSAALSDINERLQDDGVSDWTLQIIVDADSQSLLGKCISLQADFFERHWQIFEWEWLKNRLDIPGFDASWPEESDILGKIFPWISAEKENEFHKKLNIDFLERENKLKILQENKFSEKIELLKIQLHEEFSIREKNILCKHEENLLNYEIEVENLKKTIEKKSIKIAEAEIELKIKSQEAINLSNDKIILEKMLDSAMTELKKTSEAQDKFKKIIDPSGILSPVASAVLDILKK